MPVILLALLGCDRGPSSDTSSDTSDTSAPADTPDLVREPRVCGEPAVVVVGAAPPYRVTTDHYVLDVDGFDAEEAANLGRLAELAWQGFASFFGAEVEGPFSVAIAADEAGFDARLASDGIAEPEGAGGYYEPSNGRAYLYRQPTAYYSRVLLLHELTHQYQDHASRTSGLPFWYVEGLAEALGRHHWDGDCLELRVRPLLSWEDAAAAAQAELDAGVDLSAVLSGSGASRPIAQELVRLLASDPELAPGFSAWRDAVAAGSSATDLDTFAATIAPVDTVADALDAWVPADQEPLRPVWLDWIPEGDARASGFSGASAAALLKDPAERFTTAITFDGAGYVGTVYGFEPTTGDIELALLGGDGSVSRFAVLGGAVAWDTFGAASAADTVSWAQAAGEGSTAVTIGDATVDLPRTLPAAGGLALYAAEATFDGIGWE